MKKVSIFVALLMGSFFGVLSVFMLKVPDRVGPASILLFPGVVLGILMSGNGHDFRAWPVAAGNFSFYFLATYVGSAIWERHARTTDARR